MEVCFYHGALAESYEKQANKIVNKIQKKIVKNLKPLA